MSSFDKKVNADSDDEAEVEKVVATEEVEEAAPEEITTCENSDVTTKYQEAARIANAVLKEMIAGCVAGARVLDLCIAGDKSIEDVRIVWQKIVFIPSNSTIDIFISPLYTEMRCYFPL